jgi:hypothetical protein
MVDDAREQPKEVLMSTAPTAKLVASGQGKTVMLYKVRFDYKVQSAESGGGLTPGGLETYFEELAPALREHAPPSDYYALAERYGLTIQDDWIEELERTYGVKL